MTTLSTSLQLVKHNIIANKKGYGVSKTIALSGKPGIGKTERMRALCEDLEMEFLHQSMPEMDISVMSGLPEFYKIDEIDTSKYHKNNIKGDGVVWSMPELIINANIMANKNKNGVILMLDDLHQTPMSTMPYLYQLLNEKSLGNYKLDSNVHIVAALNDSESANFDGIESPVMNRMSFIKTEFDVTEFLEGYAKKFPFQIRSFLEQNPNYVNEEESTIEAFGTPRSWNSLSETFRFIEKADKKFLIDNIFSVASSNISEKASLELEKHILYVEKLDLDKFITRGKLFDVGDKSPLDQVLMGYLPNFVKTVEDGLFLSKLMEKNIKNPNFIAFTLAEIYSKYSVCIDNNDDELKNMTVGVRYVVGKILDDDDIISGIIKKADKKMSKSLNSFAFNPESKDEFFELLSQFADD